MEGIGLEKEGNIKYYSIMFGFLIKKSFFDIWDHMISTFLMNIIGLLSLFGGLALVSFLPPSVGMISLIPLSFIVVIVIGTISYLCGDFVFGNHSGFRGIGEQCKGSLKHSLLFAGIMMFLILFLFVGVPFYLSMGVFGWIVISIIGWLILFTLLALQFYFPIGKQLRNPPLKVLKKCYLILLDNTPTAVLMGLLSMGPLLGILIIPFFGSSGFWGIVISICGLFLIFFPGLGGLCIFQQNALKLIMKKYDFLEDNPECTKKDLNWDEVLFEEREKLGHRTIKGLIFPWKD